MCVCVCVYHLGKLPRNVTKTKSKIYGEISLEIRRKILIHFAVPTSENKYLIKSIGSKNFIKNE